MRIPTFPSRLPLPALRREVRYTLVQLRLLPWAKAWVPVFEDFLKQIDAAAVTAGQLGDALLDAEAAVDRADEVLDNLVRQIAATLRAVLKGEVLDTFMASLFGSERPSDFVRAKLGAELTRVRTWPAILKDAPAPALKDFVAAVTSVIGDADAAEAAQSAAEGALAAFHSSVHAPLVAQVNGQRQALGGDARKQSHDADGGTLQDGLFLVGPVSSRRKGHGDSTASLQAEVATLQAQLADAQQRLAERLAQEQLQQQADTQRKELEQKVKELQTARAATDAQIAALQAQLPGARK